MWRRDRTASGLERGERSALDQIIPLLYSELRRLAHRYERGEREGHILQTSALINEAYLRLVDSARVKWQDRAHFLAVSAELMRRILVDFVRSHRYQKRGGGDVPCRSTRPSISIGCVAASWSSWTMPWSN